MIAGPDGTRTVPVREFHVGPYETVVGPGELLIEIRVPIRPGGGSAYEKVERRVGDWPVAAAGAAIWLDGDRVADGRHRADRGRRGALRRRRGRGLPARRGRRARRSFAEAGRIAAEHCNPVADQRGPVDYKRHLAGELTTRALRRAAGPTRRGQEALTMQITVTVNGEEHTREVEPRLLLVHFLRDELGLTGTHWGCDTSNCGVCVVWLDGTPVKSCTVLAVDGRTAARCAQSRAWSGTASSTRSSRASSPVTGCSAGSARPGMMMTARWLLDQQPRPVASGDQGGDLRAALPVHRLREHRPRGPLGRRRTPSMPRR